MSRTVQTMSLYHAEIGFPSAFVAPTRTVAVEWSRHADRARWDDRYGVIARFNGVPMGKGNVFEIGVSGGKVIKYAVRFRYNSTLDMTVVLIPRPGTWLVKTVWLNDRNDVHSTLDATKYERP